MSGSLRRLGLFALIVAVATTTGCSINGGGWLQSLYTGGKVTFALNGRVDNNTGAITGEGELHDHDLKVDAHLSGQPITLTNDQAGTLVFNLSECLSVFDVNSGNPSILTGTYTPQPKKAGPGGTFVAVVFDAGKGGAGQGDFVFIEFFDGIYDGYLSCGYLQGGNIKVSP